MRVLFVNQYYPPDVAATAYLLGELSEDLARHHDVWVVAGRPSYNPEAGTFHPRGVHLERTWSTRFARARLLGRLVNYGSFVVTSLSRAMRVPRPDVVVAMTDPPVIGLIGLAAARRHRAPFVYVCQDIYPDVGVALGRVDNPAAVWLWRRLNRLIRRRAARVVAIGRDMEHKLLAEGVPRDRVALLPNWCSDPAVDTGTRRQTRREMGWDDAFVVMHGGNVGLAQNLGVLIKAAVLLRDRPDVRFVIMGDGAARPALEGEARHLGLANVTFTPYRPKDQAQTLLAAADVHTITLAPGLRGCVVPSKLYGILGLGLPFIAAVDEGSEVGSVATETGAGVRVDPNDARGLADAVVRFADGTVDPVAAGRHGREAFLAGYTRAIGTERYRRLLEALAG